MSYGRCQKRSKREGESVREKKANSKEAGERISVCVYIYKQSVLLQFFDGYRALCGRTNKNGINIQKRKRIKQYTRSIK